MDNNNYTEATILRVSSELEDIKEQLKEIKLLLKYAVDKQYYFNAFFDPELIKLQSIPDKGILLCGNYGNPNMGDEWMLDTMLDFLHRYTTRNITVMLEPNRIFDPSIYLKYNINYIHYPRTIYDYDTIVNKFDTLVFGGGAIIEDGIYYEAYDYGVNICRTAVDLPLRFIAQNKKVFCIGLSTSSTLNNQEYINKLDAIVRQATFFSLRDQYSISVLKQAGICTDNVHLVHDIVYANNQLQRAIAQKKNRVTSEVVYLGIVYIVSEETKEAFFHLLKKIKKELENQRKKYEITLIPFYDSWHLDYNFYNDVARNQEHVNVVPYNSDIQTVIDIFLQQNVMLCARYHAMLLSFCLNIPCIGLYYDTHQHYYNKIAYLLEQFGFGLHDCIPLSTLNTLNEDILNKTLNVFQGDSGISIVKEAQMQLKTIFENGF